MWNGCVCGAVFKCSNTGVQRRLHNTNQHGYRQTATNTTKTDNGKKHTPLEQFCDALHRNERDVEAAGQKKQKKYNSEDDRRRFFHLSMHTVSTFKPIVSQRWPYRMTNKSFRIAVFYAYRAKETVKTEQESINEREKMKEREKVIQWCALEIWSKLGDNNNGIFRPHFYKYDNEQLFK